MLTSMTVQAVILAAGYSQRMGKFKPLLDLGGCSVLKRCVQNFRQAGVDRILVVTGHRQQEVSHECARLQVDWVFNPDYAQGMFSSVVTAVAALPSDVQAFFVLPVDIPLVRPWTLRQVGRWFQDRDCLVASPCFQGRPGHPPLLSSKVQKNILDSDGQGGLRGVLQPLAGQTVQVPTFDRNILLDLDRPEDYTQAASRVEAMGRLDEQEAWALVQEVHPISEAGKAHGEAVGRTARCLARHLNRAGCNLDPELAYVCGVVHDVAKGQPRHEEAGGELLQGLGLEEMAPIVAAHRDLSLPDTAPVTEKEVVYLADKLTRGAGRVTVQERFQEKLDLFAQDPEAVAAITRRLHNALQVKARMESILGYQLERVLPALPGGCTFD